MRWLLLSANQISMNADSLKHIIQHKNERKKRKTWEICGDISSKHLRHSYRTSKLNMWWTGCTETVSVMAAARTWWLGLFFHDSHPHHVTKGQVVFSASSTAASPGCRCVCNIARTAPPVLTETVGETRRIAVVQSGALFSWRQPDFFFCYKSYHTRVLPHCCVGTQGNWEVWPLFFFTQGSQSDNKVSAHSQPALHWCMTVHFPCARYRESISAALSPTAAERCVVRPCTVQWRKRFSAGTLCVLKNAERRNLFQRELQASERANHTVAELVMPLDRATPFTEGRGAWGGGKENSDCKIAREIN